MQSTPTWRQQHILLFFLKVLSAACAFDGEKSMEAIQPFQDASNLCGGISSRVMMQQNRGGVIRYLSKHGMT